MRDKSTPSAGYLSWTATHHKRQPLLNRNTPSSNPVVTTLSCCDVFQGGNSEVPIGRNRNIRVAGLSQAGKTSFIQYLVFRQAVRPSPTNAPEVSKVIWKTCPLVFWDHKKFGTTADNVSFCSRYKDIPWQAECGDWDLIRSNPTSLLLSGVVLRSFTVTADDFFQEPATFLTAGLQKQYKNQTTPKSVVFDAAIFVLDCHDVGRLKLAAREFQRFLATYPTRVLLVLGTNRERARMTSTDIKQKLGIIEHCAHREWEVFLVSCDSGAGIYEAVDWLTSRLRENRRLLAQISDGFQSFCCGSRCSWWPCCG